MAEPLFIKPSQQMLAAYAFILKNQHASYTSNDLAQRANLKPGTARSYLRQLCREGMLVESVQHPSHVYRLAENWDKTSVASRLKAAYYYN